MNHQKTLIHHAVYINVMEALVTAEVDRHLKKLPERVLKYIKRSEVETFALNRLPALYASSEKGLHHQRDRAIKDFKPQIVSAVRQAFAAVQVDPIRLSQPLQIDQAHYQEAEAVLQALREWLRSPELTWETALLKIRTLQSRDPAVALPGSGTDATEYSATPPSSCHAAVRPGTYGSRLTWKPRRQDSQVDYGFEDSYLR